MQEYAVEKTFLPPVITYSCSVGLKSTCVKCKPVWVLSRERLVVCLATYIIRGVNIVVKNRHEQMFRSHMTRSWLGFHNGVLRVSFSIMLNASKENNRSPSHSKQIQLPNWHSSHDTQFSLPFIALTLSACRMKENTYRRVYLAKRNICPRCETIHNPQNWRIS